MARSRFTRILLFRALSVFIAIPIKIAVYIFHSRWMIRGEGEKKKDLCSIEDNSFERDGETGNFAVIDIHGEGWQSPVCMKIHFTPAYYLPRCGISIGSSKSATIIREFTIYLPLAWAAVQWPIRVLGRFKTGEDAGFSEGRQISVTFNIEVFRSLLSVVCSSRGSTQYSSSNNWGRKEEKGHRGGERKKEGGRMKASKKERTRGKEKKRGRGTSFRARTESNRLQSFTIVVMIITLKELVMALFSPVIHNRHTEFPYTQYRVARRISRKQWTAPITLLGSRKKQQAMV